MLLARHLIILAAPAWTWAFAAPVAAQESADKPSPADPLPPWAETFEEFLTWNVYDIAVWRMTACVLVLVVGLALKNYLIGRLLKPIDTLLGSTETEIDNALLDAVRKPLTWVVFVLAVWLAVSILNLPKSIDAASVLVLQTFGTVFVAWMLYRSISVVGVILDQFTQETDSDIDDHIVPLVKRVLRVVLVAFAIVAIIQQWGYDVTSLIAGLGIGGIAFALAAQDTLANWFGSLMIFTDRPYTLGDWVKTGSIEGVVEEVGLRSTKVRTFDKSLITVPNKRIAHDAIENFSMREIRRINTKLTLRYDTTRTQMEEILAAVKSLLTDHEMASEETMAVYFSGFGESALELTVVCFLTTAAYDEFMTAQQEIFLDVMRIVEDAGSGFAFPSQSVYVETPVETMPRKSA